MQSLFKIAMVFNPGLGGSGIMASELALALAKRGHQVHVVATKPPFRWDPAQANLVFHQVVLEQHAIFESPPVQLCVAGTLAEVIEQHQIDLVHVHYALPFGISALLALQQLSVAPPLMLTLHGTDIAQLSGNPAMARMLELVLRNCQSITAVSQALAQAEATRSLSRQARISVIPNFTDLQRFKPRDKRALREQLDLEQDQLYLIHLSNFRRVKRSPFLVEVFAQLKKKRSAKLLLLGEGPDLELVEARVKRLGLEDDVLFLGKQAQPELWLGAADLNLQLSSYESFGLTLIEAMACGTPNFATRVGGMPEVVEHQNSGYLVDVNLSARQVAKQLHKLLARPEVLAQYAQHGLARVEREYCAERVCQAYEFQYQALASGQHMAGLA